MASGAQSDQSRPTPPRVLPKIVPKLVLGIALVAGAGATYRIVSGSTLQAKGAHHQVPEIYGALPEFQFTNQAGAAFSREQLLGHVSIANFIFTRCPTVCPVFTMKMRRVAEQTSKKIRLVSFSVDPSYDTPERLAAYASKHRADTTRWDFLTGEQEQVKDTVEGALKISMERRGLDENGVPDIVHGTHFVLFDALGQIRGYYNSDDAERIASLIADAEYLASKPAPKQ
jgi:protein SCO1/2